MRRKPSWGFWLIWTIAYIALDMVLAYLLHSRVQWRNVPGAVEGAALAAAMTWLFALRRWYKTNL